jgi:hypothetical protein
MRRLIGYKVKLVLRKKESSSAARGSRRKKKIHRPQRKIKKNDLLPVLRQSEFFWKETFHLFQGRRRNDLAIYTEEVDFLVVHRSKTYGFFRFKTTLEKLFTNLFSKNTKEKQLGMYTEVIIHNTHLRNKYLIINFYRYFHSM